LNTLTLNENPTPPTLDGQGPIWLQIRRALSSAIARGDWPPGTRVPSELALTEHYGASRMTVHKAIQSLAGEGLVERRRKHGTMVADRAQERPVFEIWDIASEARRLGGRYRFELVERETVASDSHPQELHGFEAGTPMLRVVCVHYCDRHALQIEERYISVAAAPKVVLEKFSRTPPGRWLLKHVPWTEAEHTILARPATDFIARHLGIGKSDACLVVERRTWNDTQPVTFARLWHPGERYRLVGRFRPSHL
jgi:GntR family histidine utilization transcriptional repressor